MQKCLDKETLENIVTFENIIGNPMSAFGDVVDIQKDFNLFAQAAEIMENLSVCHFEQAPFDIMSLCAKDKKACDFGTIT